MKQHIKKFATKRTALFLCVFLLLSPVLSACGEKKELKIGSDDLLISDCSSGWQYDSGKLDYEQDGTEGSGLTVTSEGGLLTYSTKPMDVSAYAFLVLDIKTDHPDKVTVTVKDQQSKAHTYPATETAVTTLDNGWYHIEADLKAADKLNLTALTGLEISVPSGTYAQDSVKATKNALVLPFVQGVLSDTAAGTVQLTAGVSKSAYDSLKRMTGAIEVGFLVSDRDNEKSIDMNTKGVTVYTAEKVIRTNIDRDLYLYKVQLDGYSEKKLKGKNLRVRAYLSYPNTAGSHTIMYSNETNEQTITSWDEIAMKASTDTAVQQADQIHVIEDTTPVIQPNKISANRVPGKPYAVDVKYDDGTGVCVAIYDAAADFGAPTDGSDASSAIQAALDAAKKIGGGVVYLPEGRYTCKQPLTVPSGVTLRGEWQSPEEKTYNGNGTILMVETDPKSPIPFVSLNTGSGVRNVTVIYPETVNGNTAGYAATFSQKPSVGSDSYTLMNTTILGGSVGYDTTDVWNELPYLKNIYIANLSKGVKINNVTDIGRIENMHVDPSYLLNNKILPMSEKNQKTIKASMEAHAIGLYLQRSDWQYVYDLSITGIHQGILFDRFVDPNRQAGDPEFRGSNGQMFGVKISHCETAFDVTYTNAIGYALTDVEIDNCQNGILFSKDFFSIFEIMNLRVTGSVKKPFASESTKNGKVIISNSAFSCKTGDDYVATVNGGGLSLQNCTFEQTARHIHMSPSAGQVSVFGCSFPQIADIRNESKTVEGLYFDRTKLDLPMLNLRHVYRRSIPTAASTAVYDVTDFGAKAGVGNDSTDAFEKALAAARTTGGVVYVPRGEFLISRPLVVPTGVELRGVAGVPTHPVTAGSVLCTDYGRNNESAQALISLEESSGINGLTFFYPEQSLTEFIPYAWTVQSLGPNCWAINSVFTNSYNALDFGTHPSDGHYINYVGGTALRRGIFVGNNASNGWVENIQFNPHYWTRSATLRSDMSTDAKLQFNRRLNNDLDLLIFGDNASEHVLGTFAFGAKNLLVFEKQEKNGTNGVIIGHGSDGCRNAVKVDGIDCVAMVNSELVSMNYNEDMHHIIMQPENKGSLALYNTMAWGQPVNSSIQVHTGNLLVSQMFYWNTDKTANIAAVDGGLFYMGSTLVPVKIKQFAVSGDAKVWLQANLNLRSGTGKPHSSVETMTADQKGGSLHQRLSWWE
ncbi:MAG: hypothetical protein IKI29_05165 [Clostridia bacterium]|nr:hypothetical protein [Clostridia bacterium]